MRQPRKDGWKRRKKKRKEKHLKINRGTVRGRPRTAPEFKSATEGIVAFLVEKFIARQRRSALTPFSKARLRARVHRFWVTSGARPRGKSNPSSPASFARVSLFFVSFPAPSGCELRFRPIGDHRKTSRRCSTRLVRYSGRCGGICCESWPAQISIRAINYALALPATNARECPLYALSIIPVSRISTRPRAYVESFYAELIVRENVIQYICCKFRKLNKRSSFKYLTFRDILS